MPEFQRLDVGDPAPWIIQRATGNDRFHLSTAAGRYLLLCFFGTAADEGGQRMLRFADDNRALFDDDKLCFFGVSADAGDESEGRVVEKLPGIRHFWDFDGAMSRAYGAIPIDAAGANTTYRRFWMLLDPMLRVRAVFQATQDGGEQAALADCLRDLPSVDRYVIPQLPTPIIVLPNVFEPELCDRLIELYRADGGTESGFMREVDGKTVVVSDHSHKRRSDCIVTEEGLKKTIQNRITRRVIPEIFKVHQFKATRMERYIVACYESRTSGHFRPHRDNTTKGTAHRRFALSINLNDAFEGGEIGFPEYGPRTFKPPRGGAVVFSCSLLHCVSPVTSGERFAFLPFLYDDAAAAIREANNQYLDPKVGTYQMNA